MANSWQIINQVRYLVQQAAWPDSPSDAVFPAASVIISNSQFPREQLGRMRFPACFVSKAGFTPHGEHPTLGTLRVALNILVEQVGDEFGEAALIGGYRATTTGSSAHRGLLEVYRPVIADVVRVGRESGLSIHNSGRGSDPQTVWVTESRSLLAAEFSLEVFVSDDAGEYPNVHAFAGSETGGTVSLTWTNVPARWDITAGAATIVRKSGSAPASLGDGTTVSDGGTAGSLTNAPGAGTWYYAALAKFNEASGTRYSGKIVTAGPFAI